MLNKKRNIQALRFVDLRSRITFLILCSLAFITFAGEVTQARSLSKRSVVQEVFKEEILATERRLSYLGYWTGSVDGTLDSASRHALIAFQKVEGRQRTGKLTRAELQTLLSAIRPLPKYSGYAQVEIDLNRQVLFIVDATGTITHILPVCTGNEKPHVDHGQMHRAHTPRGRFRVFAKDCRMAAKFTWPALLPELHTQWHRDSWQPGNGGLSCQSRVYSDTNVRLKGAE